MEIIESDGCITIKSDTEITVIIEPRTSQAERAFARVERSISTLPRDTLLTRTIHGS